MIYVTFGIVALLVLIAATLHHFSLGFYEFNGAFMLIMMLLVLFMIGSAVYLSFALPSLADTPISFFNQDSNQPLTQDSASGIIFEE